MCYTRKISPWLLPGCALLIFATLLVSCAPPQPEYAGLVVTETWLPTATWPPPSPTHTVTPTAEPSPTATLGPEPSPTLPPGWTPPPTETPRPTTIADAVFVHISSWGYHGKEDTDYFLVSVEESTGIVPESIQIQDREDGLTYGPFALNPAPVPNYCELEYDILGRKFYQTDGIGRSLLPKDYHWRNQLYSSDEFIYVFIYQIRITYPNMKEEIINFEWPPDMCSGGTE